MFSTADLRPMLAVGGEPEPPLDDRGLLYEPKYDGIRAVVEVTGGDAARARLWSRNGNEKSAQFPDIVEALCEWSAPLDLVVVFDGEVVALDASGRPRGFQQLQRRIHVSVPGYRSKTRQVGPDEQPAALIVFDLLRVGDHDLREAPLTERRAALEHLLASHPFEAAALRLGEQEAGSGRALHARAVKDGWEGLLVKQARSPYRAGKRSAEWRKLKLQQVDDFVVCGYTEPQGTRARFGALVLGVAETDHPERLRYVGDVGTGFTRDEIERLWALLQSMVTHESPLHDAPAALARRVQWVAPRLSVQVRYTEMTDEGRLRHPAYLGVRDDKPPASAPASKGSPVSAAATRAARSTATRAARSSATSIKTPAAKTRAKGRKQTPAARTVATPASSTSGATTSATNPEAEALIAQLDALEHARKDGRLRLPDGDTLEVTNLHKVFWPEGPRTKGGLLRHYARVAPLILPVIADRPLVMKRLPNGVAGKAFYQHRAPDPVPDGVRAESLPDDDVPARLVGGSLKTLLYMAQLASISMDPFFSRVDTLDTADQVAIDLDPQPGATFTQILEVARWVHDILDRVGVRGYPKTSGSEGLHIFIPLPPGTPYEAGLLFCQIVSTMVATQHPKVATVERMVGRRKPKTIYVDYLQNIQGKTLACAYSARASAFAGVSAPLTWAEVDASPAPQDFTIDTMPARLASVGDLWAALRDDPGADLLSAIDALR